ncbi:MAG: tetratricopeptide repeat protein, partial [Bacteroidetes bacterium]|nr:tetratricopeptide repeat protein [Bacteroidota bacterium]
AASASLRGQRPVWPALLLFAVAVATHYMALALLPSLLFLLFRDNGMVRRVTGSSWSLFAVSAGMLVLAFVLYFLFGFQHSDSRVIMPLIPVETAAGTLSYTLLSSYHLIDLLNLVLLLGGFPLLMLLLSSWKPGPLSGAGSRSHAGKQEHAKIRDEGLSAPLRFQLIAVWSFFLFLFFANTSLGLARDWDIAAPLGSMLVMVFVESRRRAPAGENADTSVPLLQAGIVSVLLVLPWIAVNVDEDASTARFTDIMVLDDNHMYGDYALSGYEALRKHAVHSEDYLREGDILQRMIEVVGYTEQYRMLIVNSLYFTSRDPRRYMALNTWMLDRLGVKAGELRAKGKERDYAIGKKQMDSLVAVMATESITYGRHRELRPFVETIAAGTGLQTGIRVYEGADLYASQRYDEGITVFEQIRNAGYRDPRVDGMYASCLYVGGDRDRGEREFQDGLQRYGDNPQYLYMMATSYLQRDGRFTEVRALLERALALDPPDDARAQITGLLQQLQAYMQSVNEGQ